MSIAYQTTPVFDTRVQGFGHGYKGRSKNRTSAAAADGKSDRTIKTMYIYIYMFKSSFILVASICEFNTAKAPLESKLVCSLVAQL